MHSIVSLVNAIHLQLRSNHSIFFSIIELLSLQRIMKLLMRFL
uniref:Uncharacterized protein n=1 Tax=Ascaris lumbricoides TaxID=6252 RepID=A0A0M3IPV0_ASCLU